MQSQDARRELRECSLTTKMASVSARCRNEVDLAPSHSNLDEEVGRGGGNRRGWQKRRRAPSKETREAGVLKERGAMTKDGRWGLRKAKLQALIQQSC